MRYDTTSLEIRLSGRFSPCGAATVFVRGMAGSHPCKTGITKNNNRAQVVPQQEFSRCCEGEEQWPSAVLAKPMSGQQQQQVVYQALATVYWTWPHDSMHPKLRLLPLRAPPTVVV